MSNTATLYPVLLSGGSGTRLWPLSRSLYPKQLLPLVGEQTMLQATIDRLPNDAETAAATIICNNDHRFIIAEQIRGMGQEPGAIILEPVARNTAPAAAIAALHAHQQNPDAIIMLLPADHAIADVEQFRSCVSRACHLAGKGHIVTFGIRPTSPHTGYGYIRQGSQSQHDVGAYAVASFREKPDAETAATYLASGDYTWNSGMFVARADALISEFETHAPAILAAARAALGRAQTDLDFLRLDSDAFAASPSDSVDYAVMEKTDAAVVIPCDFGWSDIGSWTALWEQGDKDQDNNLTHGDVILQDVQNSYVRSETRLVSAIGVDNLTIVETPDAVLVATMDRAQDVRLIVDQLKTGDRSEHETHVRHYRPWGYYETLDLGERYQVKRLMVKPGEKLSYQMHHHRAEHWIVVTGTAQVTRGGKEILLSENQSTYIEIGMDHRLANPGKVDLEVIEIQSGSYLGEDDIVRLDDPYNRDASETK